MDLAGYDSATADAGDRLARLPGTLGPAWMGAAHVWSEMQQWRRSTWRTAHVGLGGVVPDVSGVSCCCLFHVFLQSTLIMVAVAIHLRYVSHATYNTHVQCKIT